MSTFNHIKKLKKIGKDSEGNDILQMPISYIWPSRTQEFNFGRADRSSPQVIKTLAEHIEENGHLTPIEVHTHPDDPNYVIILSGWTRHEAIKRLKQKKIKVIFKNPNTWVERYSEGLCTNIPDACRDEPDLDSFALKSKEAIVKAFETGEHKKNKYLKKFKTPEQVADNKDTLKNFLKAPKPHGMDLYKKSFKVESTMEGLTKRVSNKLVEGTDTSGHYIWGDSQADIVEHWNKSRRRNWPELVEVAPKRLGMDYVIDPTGHKVCWYMVKTVNSAENQSVATIAKMYDENPAWFNDPDHKFIMIFSVNSQDIRTYGLAGARMKQYQRWSLRNMRAGIPWIHHMCWLPQHRGTEIGNGIPAKILDHHGNILRY